uniref:Uncharacterized protein n=1 Tax=Rhizophagus irregularis (strain DAOM 181602 / DAOM 197198 / MUCL 43194) TaxID=747089 RepID=U9UE45_RHIID
MTSTLVFVHYIHPNSFFLPEMLPPLRVGILLEQCSGIKFVLKRECTLKENIA